MDICDSRILHQLFNSNLRSAKGEGHLYFDPLKIYLMCGTVSCVSFGFIVNLKLFRFFDRLKNGHLFDMLTVGYLNAAGQWWILFWFIQTLIYTIGRAMIPNVTGLGAWSSGGLFAGTRSDLCRMAVKGSARTARGIRTDRLSLCLSSSISTWFLRSAKCG